MALVVSVSKKVIQEDSLWARLSAIVDGIYSAQFLHMSTLVLSDSKEHRWAKTAFISGAALLGSFLPFEGPIPHPATSLDIKFMPLKFARHLARNRISHHCFILRSYPG